VGPDVSAVEDERGDVGGLVTEDRVEFRGEIRAEGDQALGWATAAQ
jgi:hypothetical protein